MGNTSSTGFEWNIAGSELQTSVANQELLYEIAEIIETICMTNPSESKAEFRLPLVWTSKIPLATFTSGNQGNIWIIKEATKSHKVSVSSSALRSDGQPIFNMEQTSSTANVAQFKCKVSSLEYLQKFLHVRNINKLAAEQKLAELSSLIQTSRDPFSNMFGVSGEPGKMILDAFDSFNNETDPKKKDQYSKLYKLLLLLNSFDLKLMSKAIKNVAKYSILIRINQIDIQKVSEEVEMLSAFCGRDRKNALVKIEWDLDYTFSDGYKAPPWRQVYGEISYIKVQCHDKDQIIVTASKKGFYIIKGYVTGSDGKDTLNYEAVSSVFPTLVELLRNSSPHFAENIDKQGYIFQRSSNRDPALAAAAAEQLDANDVNISSETKQERNEVAKDGKKTHNMKKKTKADKISHSNEPSLKWRALGLGQQAHTKEKSRKVERRRADSNNRNRAKGAVSSDEEYSESDNDEISDEEEQQEKRQDTSELPTEYYQIQKLVKYLRSGNQTATIIALCSLRDFDLQNELNQNSIRDVGGLETIVNLLDTNDNKCKIGALQILKVTSKNVSIRAAIAELDGMRPMVEMLQDHDDTLKCLAAETIANCARNASNRRAVRRCRGINKLVKLLKATPGSPEERIAISGATALQTCSRSTKNKISIQKAGAIPLLATLLQSTNEELLIPVVGILQECASEEGYRLAIRTTGMIKFLVNNLASNNQELQTHSASAIFKCAEDKETCVLVRQFNGIPPLVKLLDQIQNKDLLVAATGAVWKCAQNLENVMAFVEIGTIKKLVGLMDNQPEDVLVNVVGALGACAQTPEGRQGLRESNGITPLVNLLTGTNQALLANVTKAVGASALDSTSIFNQGESMAIIDRLDGVRLLWSLLKSPNQMVQASAAWAISPCIEHAKDAGEMVRSFVGGLELIVSLLKSDHPEVLASVCAAIANIARDEENLAVITDHGVVPMLGKLANTRNDKLRKHLAEAIARCCHWGNNRVAFGAASAVAPLVKYLKSPDEEVHRSTARALHQLSMDPDNCISMHEHGVVQLLLGMVGSGDTALQEAAAGTIGNIRRLALASEKAGL